MTGPALHCMLHACDFAKHKVGLCSICQLCQNVQVVWDLDCCRFSRLAVCARLHNSLCQSLNFDSIANPSGSKRQGQGQAIEEAWNAAVTECAHQRILAPNACSVYFSMYSSAHLLKNISLVHVPVQQLPFHHLCLGSKLKSGRQCNLLMFLHHISLIKDLCHLCQEMSCTRA